MCCCCLFGFCSVGHLNPGPCILGKRSTTDLCPQLLVWNFSGRVSREGVKVIPLGDEKRAPWGVSVTTFPGRMWGRPGRGGLIPRGGGQHATKTGKERASVGTLSACFLANTV